MRNSFPQLMRALLRMTFFLFVMVACYTSSAEESVGPAATESSDVVSYYDQIRPLLQAKCQGCHQPAKPLGGYQMTSMENLRTAGESGETPIVPGLPGESYLLDLIRVVDGEAEMPKQGAPLTDEQFALIQRWIKQGAVDDTPATAKVTYSADNPPVYSRPPVVTSLDYSPDGQLIAISGFHEVLLHEVNADQNQPIARLVGMSPRVESVRFSPDGKLLAAVGGKPATYGEVQIWDVESQELLLSSPQGHDTIYGASWSPDGKLLAFGCADSTVRVIRVETGEQVLYQGSHNDWVFDTVFSQDGSHLVSVGRDMTAKLIEVKTERFVDNITSITPKALKGGIQSVVRHPHRDTILFGGADGIPKIYQMHRTTARKIGDDANLKWELPALPGRIFGVAFSRDAARIVAGSSLDGHGAVHIYGIDPDYQVPKEIQDILNTPTHSRSTEQRQQLTAYFEAGIQTLATNRYETAIYAVAFHPDGSQVAAAGGDGRVRLIRSHDGGLIREFLPVELQTKAADNIADRRVPAPSSAPFVPIPLKPQLQVERVQCDPAEILLHDANAYNQVVVTATLASGDTLDVTRVAQLRIEGGVAEVSTMGRVTPTADGTGKLLVSWGDQQTECRIQVAGMTADNAPDYIRDVMPVISRMGCNAGTCHGAKDGKNGFKLSLRGYDPIYDIRAFTDDIGSRRVNVASAEDSLILQKCTAAVPHEGGQLTTVGSPYYTIVRDWIAAGAKLDESSARVVDVAVFPQNPVVQRVGDRQQLRITATYADGTSRDVTQEAFVSSSNTDVATLVPGHAGLMTVQRRGEAALLVRFEGNYAATTVTVMGDRDGFQWQDPPTNGPIDNFVNSKLKRTKTLASPLCTDYEFVRRVHLDLTGLPPTTEQIRRFVDDARDSRWKRDELIDRLIGSPAYVEHWSNKWADLLQVNSKFLGSEGAQRFRDWIRDSVQQNMPYDEFVRTILTAEGSTLDNPAASYFKILRTPAELMENTTHLFLATRFNCNKCHDHPFERWTQDQYYEMAAFFARVGLKKDDRSGDKTIQGTAVESRKPLYEIVFEKSNGEVTHDRTGEVTAPQTPYAAPHDVVNDASRRQQLAAWMTSPDNRYFAKTYVNRLWGYLTGTGIIEPIDDTRAGNPPTNPALLDYLTKRFVDQDFNVREVIREICKSRTYQLSVATNRWNEDDHINYSHAKARRLPAEVLFDAIQTVTGSQSNFPHVPAGTRAAALPDVGIQLPDGFLGNLGRPARESACECERSNDVQLGSVMALVSGPTLGEALSHGENALVELVREHQDDDQLFHALFLRILNRPASPPELAAARQTLQQIDAEHQALLGRLDQAEREWKPIEADREVKRWQQIAAAERELNRYLAKTRQQRETAAADREAKIASARKQLADFEADIATHLQRWEAERAQATKWQTIDFAHMTSTFGANLTQQEDGSIFAAGSVARGDYHLDASTDLERITGLRIEALPDERLPKKGPGRADDGNFVISELELHWANRTSPSETELARWQFDQTTASQTNRDHWVANDQLVVKRKNGVLHLQATGNDPMLTQPVAAKGRLFLLEIDAKLTADAESQVFWSTKDQSGFAEERSVRLTLSGANRWLPYRYYFEADSDLTALRLDPLTQPGALSIRQIRLVRVDDLKLTPRKFKSAEASFSQNGYAVAEAINGKNDDNGDGWAISPQAGHRHEAIFTLAEPIESPVGKQLKLVIRQNYRGNKYSLGRFRVSVTSSREPLTWGVPAEISAILQVNAELRTDEQNAQLLAHFRKVDSRFSELKTLVAEAEKPLPVDPELTLREQQVTEAKKPIHVDPALVRLRQYVAASRQQQENKRLTAAQDLAWALINSPAFLFNH